MAASVGVSSVKLSIADTCSTLDHPCVVEYMVTYLEAISSTSPPVVVSELFPYFDMIFNEFPHFPKNPWPVSFGRCDGLNGKQATHRDDEFLSIPNTQVRIAAPKVECVDSKRLSSSIQVFICFGHENRGTEFDRG